MTDDGDLHGVGPEALTEQQTDDLLSGAPSPWSGLAETTALFAAARRPAAPDELVGKHAALAAFVVGAGQAPVVPINAGPRRAARSRPVRRAVFIGAAASMLAFGTAAAKGSLPAPVQRVVAKASKTVGIHVPSPSTTAHGVPTTTTTAGSSAASRSGSASSGQAAGGESPTSHGTRSTGPGAGTPPAATAGGPSTTLTGPDVTGPAKVGLCRAWTASGKPKNSKATAFQALEDAAKAAKQTVEQFCATTEPGVTTGVTTGATSSVTSGPATTVNATTVAGNGKGNGKGHG